MGKRFSIMSWLRSIIAKVFPGIIAENTGDSMEKGIERWMQLYYDKPPWSQEINGQTMNLPAAICSEFARLIMVEFDVEINGSERADYLNRQFKRLTKKLRINLEECCALGGILFKPYVSGGQIYTDCITQERFWPVRYDDDSITAIVCLSQITKGQFHYFRIEKQEYDALTHTHSVTSKYYISTNSDTLGREIKPEEYPEKGIPDYAIRNVDRPLFAFYRLPIANKIDKESPLGVSVFESAIKKIEEADKQWARYLWEFAGGELAIDADERYVRFGNQQAAEGAAEQEAARFEMPAHKKRLFRRLKITANSQEAFYKVFAPALRDSSYAAGLDTIMRQIEFDVGLAYGTLSNPQNVDKTAEEIKASKQRSYATVSNMQQDLQAALEDYIYALDQYADACNLAPAGSYEIQWNWGDGILEDAEKETQIRLQEVNSNVLDKVRYLMWRYGKTESEARAMLPAQSGFSDYFSGDGVG